MVAPAVTTARENESRRERASERERVFVSERERGIASERERRKGEERKKGREIPARTILSRPQAWIGVTVASVRVVGEAELAAPAVTNVNMRERERERERETEVSVREGNSYLRY